MDIDQIFIISLLLLIFITLYENKNKNKIIENFTGEINLESCLQRILENGCIDVDERQSINNDCSEFIVQMPHGESNISCENQTLFNWLICQQMITNGACECKFGRNQIDSLCGGDPLNIDCPLRLSSPNNEVFDKIKELEQMTCENIEHREQKVKDITNEIELLLQDMESEKNEQCFGNYLSIVLFIIILILIVLFFIFAIKKNKIN